MCTRDLLAWYMPKILCQEGREIQEMMKAIAITGNRCMRALNKSILFSLMCGKIFVCQQIF